MKASRIVRAELLPLKQEESIIFKMKRSVCHEKDF